MTDVIQVTINNEWKLTHGLSTGIFTFDLSPTKGQAQGYAHFENEYLENI